MALSQETNLPLSDRAEVRKLLIQAVISWTETLEDI